MNIVRLCPMCHGYPEQLGPYGCYNCPNSARGWYHPNENAPGPGYILRGLTADEFPVGAIVRDVYSGERMRLHAPRKGRPVLKSLDREFEWEEYQRAERYVTPEEWADPACWTKPERGPVPQRAAPPAEQPRQLGLFS